MHIQMWERLCSEYKEQLNFCYFVAKYLLFLYLKNNKHLQYTFGIALIDHLNGHLFWICQVQLFIGSSGLYLEK